jgi:tetratricopeptide (TPR) repeat protein
MPFASRSAAMHIALWSIDRGYRLSWYVWPVSIAVLICGWIYVERPVSTAALSSARRQQPAPSAPAPAPPAPARSANRSPVEANPFEKRSVIIWPEKLLADSHVCHDDALGAGPIIEACTRMIESGLLDERQLVAAYSRRGFYYAATQTDRALADYDAALKIQPDSPAVLTDRAWIYLEHDRVDAAMADANKAIELLPRSLSARARLYRANAFLALNAYTKAVSDLDDAQGIDPADPHMYLTRGDIENALKHYDDALQAYDEFTKRAPRFADGLVGRGLVLEATGHPKEAVLALESALKLDPKNSEAIAARGRLRSAQKTSDR